MAGRGPGRQAVGPDQVVGADLPGACQQLQIGEIDLAALRTGDTPQWERTRMTRQRPHILVTTPESLYILLTAVRPRAMLGGVRTIITDEIHAVADDKRGSHLALTLARLDRLVEQSGGPKPQRIGLSATVRPVRPTRRLAPGGSVIWP